MTSETAPTFGIYLNTGEMLAETHDAVFDFTREQAELAESLGYHDLWITEHHFIPFGINSCALTLAGFLLGHTKKLRVGTAVTLAPLYHPLQLAEQTAVLDQASGGRFDFGIGRGGYLLEYDAFGADYGRWDKEIAHTARVVLDAWRGQPIAFGTKVEMSGGIRLKPQPRTKPNPPLCLGTATPAGLKLAAEEGLPILHYFATPVEARKKVEAAYKDFQPQSANPPAHVHTLIAVVSDDETGTREQLRRALNVSFADGDWPHVPQAPTRHKGPDGKEMSRETMAQGAADRALVGPPDRVAAGINKMRSQLGANRFVLNMESIGNREMTLASIRRFAEEVIPLVDCEVVPEIAVG